MKSNHLLLIFGIAYSAASFNSSAQTTPAGNNTMAPLSSESQTPSPAGQTDFQTDPFTGRFGYTVPLDLAPARHGSTPNLELTYNSANPNSWCGVGWDLDLGYIERETKYGVPVQWSGGHSVLAYDDTKGFLFSFKNKMSDLVQIPGGAYRAQVQNDFLQFQFNTSGNEWVVTDKSGTQYYFGSASGSRMTNPKSGWASGETGTFRWALDTIITATGDKATISYTSGGGRLYPQTYSYNGSTGGSGISPLDKVQFYLTTTNRTDTTISCRAAYAVTNQFLLGAITHSVNGQMVWSNKLNYITSSSTERSLLTSMTHYGSDLSSTLPPLTFGYSRQSFTFQPTNHWGNLALPPSPPGYAPADLVLYQALNNPVADLVDVDGDGLPDRIIAPDESTSTTWWVQHNTGSGFANPVVWTLGTQNGGSYNTSTDPSWAEFNTHGRVLDINGDGLPDLVVDPISMFVSGGSYPNQVVQLNTSTALASQTSWTNVIDQHSNPYYSADGNYRAVENYPYLAMLDMNGDGLPDRVMVQPGGAMTSYLVQFNTGSGYGGTNFFGPFHAQGVTNNIVWDGLSAASGSSGNMVSMRMLDINGDGLPDRIMLVLASGSSGPATAQYQTNLVVELNNGYGFEPAMNWTNINSYYETNCGGGSTSGIADLGDDAYVAYRDINGDGLPDRIVACQCSYSPYTNWLVQINTGTGFGPFVNWGPVNSQGQTTTLAYCGIQATVTNGLSVVNGSTLLLDMNGDGLPDRVEYAYPGNNNFYVVELSSGPFPDLMIAASNGLGGVVNTTYKPATQWDNRASTTASPAQYLLPFPLYTVSSVSVSDGIYASNTTTYSYTGGYWNYAQHQFNGFAQTTVSDPLNMTNIHWFHQAGGRNNSAFGEYQDSTNAIGKVGMEYRTDTIGSDGNLYHLALNQINESVFNSGEHFAYAATTLDFDYPAPSTAYKATAKQFAYNLSNGNLTSETDWGAVTPTATNVETFTDIAGDTVYHLTTYASLSNTNIVDKPQSETLSLDSGGVNILRQKNYTYNGSTGVTLQESNLICSGSWRTTTYGYDSYNNINSETDPTDVQTLTTYDSTFETFPVTTTEGSTFTTTTTYDPRSGKLYLSTDPAGLVTSNRYDVFLRLAETDVSTTPNGATSDWLDKYTYMLGVSSGPQNSVLRQQSDGVDLSNGHETITWSDGLGRPIQTRAEAENGQYRVVDTAYDQRGNIDFVSLPYFSSGTSRTAAASGLGTLHGFDPIGRRIQVTASVNGTFSGGALTGTSATGGDSGSPIATASLAYYYSGDPWTWVTTDETGSVHRYTRDAYGRTNQIVEVNGSQSYTTLLNWNLASDLLSVTDNSNNVIQYSNNLVGEVVAVADPDMGVWTYQRDYAGRLRVQTDGDGQAVHFNYSPDPLGRLLSRQVYDLKGNFYYGITNVYDSSSDPNFTVYPGQLYEEIDSEGYSKNGYDVRGRKIIAVRYLVKNGNTYTNRYTFDDLDRTRSIAYPNGGPTVTNIYDIGANLSEVQQVGGTTFYHATSFNPLDQLAAVTYGNGLAATYSYYGNSKRLQSAATSGGLQSLTYTYDQVADILSISDGAYSGAASAAISGASYDSLHRLLGFTRPGTGQTFSCTYDAIGNMMSYSENGSAAYTYVTPTGTHLPHAIKTANGLIYTYDLCGNMLTRGSQSLVYNPENRLIGSAVSNQTTTFGYDAGGNRLWKEGASTNTLQVWIGGNYEEKDGKVLFHISAADRMVYTYSSDGSVAEYYHPDHLHSAEVMSTAGGGLYQHYEYAAYGNSRYTSSTTAFPVTRRYTSQSFDEETGLYDFGARYYDPVIGRFIQPDTMIANAFNPQAYDRYSYALDNPLLYVDPDGHSPWYFYIPGIGPGAAQIQGTFALNAQAQQHGYENYNTMAAQLGIGQNSSTAGDVAAVQGAANVASGAANAYLNVAQEVATAGIGTGMAAVTTAERRVAEGTSEAVGGATGENAAGSATQKTFQTYTKENPLTGEVYSGRTSGRATPEENVATRDANHHMNDQGFASANLDKSSTNPNAIRGREQQLIEKNGGAKSQGGTSGNKINGISPKNPNSEQYRQSATKEFSGEDSSD
jgi:RHS repeat-associated protein